MHGADLELTPISHYYTSPSPETHPFPFPPTSVPPAPSCWAAAAPTPHPALRLSPSSPRPQTLTYSIIVLGSSSPPMQPTVGSPTLHPGLSPTHRHAPLAYPLPSPGPPLPPTHTLPCPTCTVMLGCSGPPLLAAPYPPM